MSLELDQLLQVLDEVSASRVLTEIHLLSGLRDCLIIGLILR